MFLSLSLVLGLFGCIPASAETTLTVGNLTHLDTTTNTNPSYQEKLDASTIVLDEKYQANIQLSNMVGSAFADKVKDDTNLIRAAKYKGYAETSNWKYLTESEIGNLVDMQYYNYLGNSDTASPVSGTSFGSGNILDNISYEAIATSPVKGAARYENGNDFYDVLLTAELKERTKIEKILYVNHIAYGATSSTYAIYVSDYADDLYSPENQVFLFDNYSAPDDYRFNGKNSPNAARGSEGPYLEFTGDNLPTGKYVGFKFYDASRSQDKGYFYVYDLFVSGEPIKNLEIAPSETVYTGTETYENKLAYLKASVNHNYQATLQLADLTKETLSEKIADETNMISGGEYQTFSSKDTNNWTTLTPTDITKITDKRYVGTSGTATCFGGNEFLANSGYNINTCGDSEEMKGANRVANNKYDLMMTLELEKKISIDKLYIVGHPNPGLGPFLYTVYVSNSKENLYSYENEVFHYDFSTKAPDSENWKFNGSSGSSNRTGEIQYLEFKGDKLPTGKYIGIKFYDTSGHATYHGAFNLYEVGVFGDIPTNITYLDKAVENDVSADETATFAEKLALLDATSQYAGTGLRMTAMTKDYVNNLLVETDAQNLIKSAKIKYYTDNDFADVASAIITNVTNGDFAHGNGDKVVNTGTNSYIGSTGEKGLFYDGELHGQDRVDSDVDVYDALISLDLGETTEINDFYMFNHVNPDTSVVTYKLYVSDSQSDLFENGNEVAYWNYYNGYKKMIKNICSIVEMLLETPKHVVPRLNTGNSPRKNPLEDM